MDETKRNDGGPAFPSHGSMGEVVQEGMSLRDYFAGQALVGLGHLVRFGDLSLKEVAHDAYMLADAMIAERSK